MGTRSGEVTSPHWPAEFGDPVPTRTSPAPELSDAEREERLRRAFAKAPEYGMGFVMPPPGVEG
jgi:hypothetical protein